MAALHLMFKFPFTMTMDDRGQECEFWYGGKLCTYPHVPKKKQVHVIMWIFALQTTSLMHTKSVAMEMIS